jgi:hypothetical protein
VLVAAALAALAPAAARPAVSAASKSPCARQIIEDWVADNRIDRVYPLHCYREAIAAVPEDLKAYTGIVEDIMSARQQASRVRTLSGRGGTSPSTRTAGTPDRGLFKQAFDKLGPRNADTVPLPLLILAGLSLLLIAAGAAGLVSRRLRTDRGYKPPPA